MFNGRIGERNLTNNFLPYYEIKSNNFGKIRLLIDTGANKNYINPDIVPKHAIALGTNHKIKNISGSYNVSNYTRFNPFEKFFKNLSPQKFFLFKFHNFFDGLIGFETLRSINAIIDTGSNSLKIGDTIIPLNKKLPDSIILNANETNIVSVPTVQENGDFLVENDLPIAPNIFILSGVYSYQDRKTNILVHNGNTNEQNLNIGGLLDFGINNFEMKSPIFKPNKNKLFEQLRLDHLNQEEKKQISKLIQSFQDIFFLEGQKLSFTNAIKHKINTSDELPVYTKTYRYPYFHKEEVRKQIDSMLNQGIIRPSISPWSSPIWIVPKKIDASGQKKWRLVVDYRKLNEKTVGDRYPIPNITDILDKLGRCMYFSTLDLASGFHQIEVNERDIQKTAFNVDSGHYEFVRMPFGLKNAPSTFQRVMDNILREHIGKRCLVYMDDIIVFSTSLQEQIQNLKSVFESLAKANMKIQLDKSEFLRKEVAFLGHVVTPEGVKPNPEKIATISNWPIPKNEKELKGFLGVMGYYRKFIKGFAKIAKPLTSCLRKGESITYTKPFLEAFEKCKSILTSSQVLIYPDFEKPFILTTDASNYAIGAVLSQGPVGQDRPIAFASRTLSKTEENYSTIEKELLAMEWGCKYFRPYLFGRQFTLFTDHKPLTYAIDLKDKTGRLSRMAVRMKEYEAHVKYRPGNQNVVADGLSRIPSNSRELEVNVNDQSDSTSDDATVHSADSDDGDYIPMTELPLNYFKSQIILKIGEQDEEIYEEIFPGIHRRTVTRINFGVPFCIRLFREKMHPTRINGILCPESIINTLQVTFKNYFSRAKTFKIKLTQSLLQDLKTIEEQELVIKTTHERAHRGIDENHTSIIRKFYFPQMKKKITSHINLCETCLENKYERNPYKIKFADTPIPKKPLDIVHIDIFESRPNLFLSAVDKLSRFAIIIPIKSRSIPDLKKAILKLITSYGTPCMLVSDNEPALRSTEIRGLLHRLNCETYYTPSDTSQVNGIVEIFHRTLSEIFLCMKQKFEDLSDKEIYKLATSLYNTTIHSVTKLKPIEVFFGIKEGEERPLNLETILENRNAIFDELILKLVQQQKKTNDYRNKSREHEPHLDTNESVYNKLQGIRNKKRQKYKKQKVRENRRKTFIDCRNIKLHKSKLKRKRKL